MGIDVSTVTEQVLAEKAEQPKIDEKKAESSKVEEKKVKTTQVKEKKPDIVEVKKETQKNKTLKEKK